MTPEEIVAKFINALEQFESIDGQPYYTYLKQIWEVVAPFLLQIPYEKTGRTHNPTGLIWPVEAYTTRYGAAFVEPTLVGAYDATIDNNTTAVVRGRTEAAHKAKRDNHDTYETERRETAQFILAVVKDTWVR